MIPDKAFALLVKKRRISRWIESAGECIYRPTLEERETARRLLAVGRQDVRPLLKRLKKSERNT